MNDAEMDALAQRLERARKVKTQAERLRAQLTKMTAETIASIRVNAPTRGMHHAVNVINQDSDSFVNVLLSDMPDLAVAVVAFVAQQIDEQATKLEQEFASL